MAVQKYINIKFPFQNSDNGFFVQLNKATNEAIKIDLMHLLLTRKGQRLYNPDFGTDLIKFIFEPNDEMTLASLTTEIKNSVKKYLPNLDVTNISVVPSPDSDYAAVVTINYTITDNVFTTSDLIIINI